MQGGELERSCHFFFSAFPRRAERLQLDLVFPGTSTQSVHLTVANPARSLRLTNWLLDRLPASREVDNLTFTLKDLQMITNGIEWLRLRPSIAFTRHGGFADDWSNVETEIEDFQGNVGGEYRQYCFRQPAYRIRAIAWPSGKAAFLQSNVSATFEFGLPPAGQMKNFETNFYFRDLELQLLGLSFPGIFYLSNNMIVGSTPLPVQTDERRYSPNSFGGKFINGRFIQTATLTWPTPRLLFKPFPVHKQRRFAFRARNQNGQTTSSRCQSGEEGPAGTFFDLNLPPDSTTIALEMILVEPRIAEFFVASPAVANAATKH